MNLSSTTILCSSFNSPFESTKTTLCISITPLETYPYKNTLFNEIDEVVGYENTTNFVTVGEDIELLVGGKSDEVNGFGFKSIGFFRHGFVASVMFYCVVVCHF